MINCLEDYEKNLIYGENIFFKIYGALQILKLKGRLDYKLLNKIYHTMT